MRSVFLCPPGPHVFLLVIDTDASFTEQQHDAVESQLEDHMVLFGEDVWKFTLVLFTYGDQLGDQAIKEHIMVERPVLQKLVERCGNRYHVLDNKSKSESNQVPKLLERIKEMVAINEGKHYIPNMTEFSQRVEREISVCLEEKWKKREAEIYDEFKDYLSKLMMDLRGQEGSGPETSDTSLQPKPAKQDAWWKPKVFFSLINQSKRTEKVEKKICEKLKSMEADLKSNIPDSKMRNSFDYIGPSMSDRAPKEKFDEVLAWMSTMKIENEDPPTFNYSQATSGYQSNISDVFSRGEIEEFKDYLSRLLRDLEEVEVPGLDTSDMSLQPEPAKQGLRRKVRSEKIEEMKKNIIEKIDSLETELQNVSDSN
ncbi:GTPase IMAP family member 4-like isoform X3 [Alosa sapidissima]|nr:GTPase IMAP family member 4-like isoform X3 [Alosa sapidissima]